MSFRADKEGTIFYRSRQLLTYGNDIDIIGLKDLSVSYVFSRLHKETKRMVIVVNDDLTKYLLSSHQNVKVENNFFYIN